MMVDTDLGRLFTSLYLPSFTLVNMVPFSTIPISEILSLSTFKRVMGISEQLPAWKADSVEALLGFREKLPTIKQAGELLVDEAMRRAKGNQFAQ